MATEAFAQAAATLSGDDVSALKEVATMLKVILSGNGAVLLAIFGIGGYKVYQKRAGMEESQCVADAGLLRENSDSHKEQARLLGEIRDGVRTLVTIAEMKGRD